MSPFPPPEAHAAAPGTAGSDDGAAPGSRRSAFAPHDPLSDGEVHFLWHFVQGGFMDADVRVALRRAWGMCERHAFAFLAVDAAFRHGHLHGPALVYEDLMQAALGALGPGAPSRRRAVARALRDAGPCPICALGYGPRSAGFPSDDVATRGRDLTEIRRFALATERDWRSEVCCRCAGTGGSVRCRRHLASDLRAGRPAALEEERERVSRVAARLRRYSRSFRWELRGTDTPDDRAALVAAAGWCGGWGPWLWIAGENPGQEPR